MRISVVTPTWRRHQLLMARCVSSVFGQTWPDVEHVIVSDGPDRELAELLSRDLWRRPRRTRSLVFDQLPEHLDDGPVDYGARARNRGVSLATGELVAYLDDDNSFRPEHIETLAAAFDDPAVDFAYSRMLTHPDGNLIGAPFPTYGGIDTSLLMHRRDTLERFGQWLLPGDIVGDKHAPDWAVVARWLDRGAGWAHVPEVTVDYFFPSMMVQMAVTVSGLRNGRPWPRRGAVVDLPLAEAVEYLNSGVAVPAP